MSDNGSGTPLRNVDKIIEEALKVCEKFGFKDMDLWETFQDDFDGFTEEDFKSASVHHQRKLRAYLRKYGVWVRKQQRYTIARSLHELLLEEEPTPWTEAEILACEEKEEFASYQISRLIDSDFGRKPRKSRALTPTSTTGPPPVATPSAPAPFASPSPTPGPSAQAPANTPIYPMQPPGTGTTPTAAYMQPPGTGFPPPAHMPPGTGPTPAAYMKPSGITPATAYAQPPGIEYTPAPNATPAPYASSAGHTQPSTGHAHSVNYPPSGSNPSAATITTSIGHSRELSNLAKIYTDEAKYSGRNDSFTFKLAIFHDICSSADVPPEAKMKAFPTMLKGLALDYYSSNIGISRTVMNSDQIRYSIRRKWKKWDKTKVLEVQSYCACSSGKPTKRDLPLPKYFATAEPLPPYYYTDGDTEIIICNYHCYLRICYAEGRGEPEDRISVIKGGTNGMLE